VRPEIRQYFVEADLEGTPFNRENRSLIYSRSKKMSDTMPLGTRRDVYEVGYEWVNHSIWAEVVPKENERITFGGPDCLQPYSGSILNISGMSYGALSENAIVALSTAAKLGGFYHNTGEGGISRFHREGGGDLVWNVGTGYFGCRTEGGQFCERMFAENACTPQVKMVEIKLSQGAKPAHGGMLPKEKITPAIAEARGLVGRGLTEDCNSPARHSAFANPRELMLFVRKLRGLSGGKPVGFKLCVGRPKEFAALVRAMLETGVAPDFITVDGGEGGTGAAPPEFSNHVGMPLMEGIWVVRSILEGAGLRDRVKIIASGRVVSGFSLVKALAMGADACNAARAMMFALGCIQALKCNTNKCPTGITTQDPELMQGLHVPSKALRVANFQMGTVCGHQYQRPARKPNGQHV
jgi:glutamate synthase domain-containing protein 2